jgi:hypothetical protein
MAEADGRILHATVPGGNRTFGATASDALVG